MILMGRVIHRRYVAAIKYILIAITLITILIIIIQKGKNKMRNQKDISKYSELIDYNSKKVNNYLKNHYKGWSYCEGCDDWFLDEEDCNCEQ